MLGRRRKRRDEEVFRQEVLLREAMVLGFAEGARFGGYIMPVDDPSGYPKDSEVVRRVLRTARSFNDTFPALATVEPQTPYLSVDRTCV